MAFGAPFYRRDFRIYKSTAAVRKTCALGGEPIQIAFLNPWAGGGKIQVVFGNSLNGFGLDGLLGFLLEC
jgi:hypothetical protein